MKSLQGNCDLGQIALQHAGERSWMPSIPIDYFLIHHVHRLCHHSTKNC